MSQNLYENVIKKYAENFKNNISVTITNHDENGVYNHFFNKEHKAGITFFLPDNTYFEENNQDKIFELFLYTQNFNPLFRHIVHETKTTDGYFTNLLDARKIKFHSFDEYVEYIKQTTSRMNNFNFDEYAKFYKNYRIAILPYEHFGRKGCCIYYRAGSIDKETFEIPYEPGKKVNLKANKNISSFNITTKNLSIPFEAKNSELVLEYELGEKMSVSAKNISSQDFIKLDAITMAQRNLTPSKGALSYDYIDEKQVYLPFPNF